MKDESLPQTLPSFCINRTTVLIAGLAGGRDRMKSSIAFMLLWNEHLFHCLDDSLLFLFEPVFIFICIWTFVTFICNWTCILPSIGEKKRRQGQWMRLSQWDNNLQPGQLLKTNTGTTLTLYGHPFAKTTSIIRLSNTNSTWIHSNARLESVCHSLPERNSQDAASDAQRL